MVPDVVGDDPRVDFDRLRAGVGFTDEIGEGIEGRWCDVGGLGFDGGLVVGVAAFADLDEDGVEVAAAGVGDQLGDLGGGAEAGVEGVGPQRSELGCRADGEAEEECDGNEGWQRSGDGSVCGLCWESATGW